MAIFSVLLSLAIPSFKGVLENQKLYADARQLATSLRATRNDAIYNEYPAKVQFYTADNSYLVTNKGFTKRYYLSLGIKYVGTTTFSASPVDKVPYCSFNSTGTPNQGGTVTLKNSRGTNRYIIVNPVAGRVRISDKKPANWK